MAKVTYLFGAGASAGNGTLPITKEIPQILYGLYREIEEYKIDDSIGFTDVGEGNIIFEIRDKLVSDLKWLHENVSKHSSIDTLAKKLYLTKKSEDLDRLKFAFSAFLAYLQSCKGGTMDRRYDTFLASILSERSDWKPVLPNNIKVLSWNYDFQLELAFKQYYNSNLTITDIKDDVKSISTYNFTNNIRVSNGFQIIKLNGNCCNFYFDENPDMWGQEVDLFILDEKFSIIDFIIGYYKSIKKEPYKYCGIQFAWEDPHGKLFNRHKSDQNSFVDFVKDSIKETEVIVVVGYSFPFFNRKIDQEIFKNLQNDRIQKVYIQDVYPDNIVMKFKATAPHISDEKINVIRVNPDNENEEFFLPYELSL